MVHGSRGLVGLTEIAGYESWQESCAVVRKPRDAAGVLFGLKFANNIHYKLKSSQAPELQTYQRKTELNANNFRGGLRKTHVFWNKRA